MPKTVTCQVPERVIAGVRTLQIQTYRSGFLITRLIDRFAKEMIVTHYESITSKISDVDFFKKHSIQDYKIDDLSYGFFEQMKSLNHLSGIILPNGVAMKNNNGAILRELLFRALHHHSLMSIDKNGMVEMADK